MCVRRRGCDDGGLVLAAQFGRQQSVWKPNHGCAACELLTFRKGSAGPVNSRANGTESRGPDGATTSAFPPTSRADTSP